MNAALYRQGIRASWKLFAVMAAVLTLYFTIIISMFDPEMGAALDELARAMPQLMAMIGMSQTADSLVLFMVNYLYGFLMLVFPMVYTILTANRLVASQVDRGTMATLLAAPVPRWRVLCTQLGVLLSGIVLLVGYATVLGLGFTQLLFPGQLDVTAFLLVNLGALALHLLIGGICFLASCLFNDTGYSLALGAGVPCLAFLIQMLANAGEQLETARYATFFTLYRPEAIVRGEGAALASMAVMAAAAVALYLAAGTVFVKKDIPV